MANALLFRKLLDQKGTGHFRKFDSLVVCVFLKSLSNHVDIPLILVYSRKYFLPVSRKLPGEGGRGGGGPQRGKLGGVERVRKFCNRMLDTKGVYFATSFFGVLLFQGWSLKNRL